MHTIVVQVGLPTIPLGMLDRAAALTSGTTRGTAGSIRQAEELSMTTAPASATRGAHSRDAVAPIENRAKSIPPCSAVATSSTTTPSSDRPADREEAKYRVEATGNPRDAS